MKDPVYDSGTIKDCPVWRHVKTGSLYHVVGIARCSTNGEREGVEQSVVYFSMDHQHLCYREVSEFLDGRFVPVGPSRPPYNYPDAGD